MSNKISNRRLVAASGPDFYPTPEWATRALLQHVKLIGPILEPCCGDGAMAKILEETGEKVCASDISDRGYGDICDFLEINRGFPNIVTNPPFNVAENLLEHALELATKQVCFLLRTAFLESKRRYDKFFHHKRPTTVLVFSERLSMYPKGYEVRGGGTTSYAWFVWNKLDTRGISCIEWIAPGLKPRWRA